MSRGKPRKLIRLDKLLSLHRKVSIGVPLARALRDLELDISRPLAAKQLKLFETECESNEANRLITDSMDPPWLDAKGPAVQEQPSDWDYEGYFPFGKWVEKSE